MKKIFKRATLILVVMLVLFASIGTAQAATVNVTFGPNVTGVLDTVTGNLVISGTGSMTDFEFNNSPLNGNIVKTVTINNGITHIGNNAFHGCTGLTSITIPHSVTSMGANVFYGCSSLTSITIPDTVTSMGIRMFESCTSLTSVTLPNGITSIYTDMFNKCSSLKSITIPDTVTSIGQGAFSFCTSLESIIIPDGVTSIGLIAFRDCISIESITIPDSVTNISMNAFLNCTGLTSITLSNKLINIGNNAFRNCTSLTSITLPASLTNIGLNAFDGCLNIDTMINHYDGVQTIGASAFLGMGSSAQTKNAYLMDTNTSFAEAMLALGFTLNPILPSYTDAGCVETTLPLTGTIDALLMSVTHPASVEYTINPDFGYNGGSLIAPDIAITNNTLVPINVTLTSMRSAEGGSIQFIDVMPHAYDWAKLNVADSKKYIALGIRIADETGWRAGHVTETRYAAESGNTLFGSIGAGATAKLSIDATHGRAFDQNHTASYNLVFLFNLT